MKKQSLIILIIVLLLLVAGIVWYLFGRQETANPADETSTEDLYFPSDAAPGAGSFGETSATEESDKGMTLTQLTDSPAAAFWVDATDATLYTVSAAGVVVATPFGGSPDITYGGDGRPLLEALPSARGDSVLLTTGTRTEPTISLVNVVTGASSFLPQTAKTATWHPNGKDVIFMKHADAKIPEGIALFTAGKKTVSLLAPLALGEVLLAPHSETSILLYERPAAELPSSAWELNLKTGGLTTFAQPQPGLLIKHAPSAKYHLLYAKGKGLSLQSSSKTTALPDTLPQKCSLGETELYCAVPTQMPPRMPFSYLDRSQYTIDELFMIRLSGETKRIWPGENDGLLVDIYAPSVVGDAFYFINRYDNRVYSLGPIQ